jgi:hypothetical protein
VFVRSNCITSVRVNGLVVVIGPNDWTALLVAANELKFAGPTSLAPIAKIPALTSYPVNLADPVAAAAGAVLVLTDCINI